MPAPANTEEFVGFIRKSRVIEDSRLDAYLQQLDSHGNAPTALAKFAGQLVTDGILTNFQAEQFLAGKWKRFSIGKYKVLERLGQGGMGQVFLCEHKLMHRRVAIKVLPTAKAEDPAALARFYREARAVAALDHPNLVRAFDIDQDDGLHYLVMEYVDGVNFQDLVKKSGPLDVLRACHYVHQAAIGLDYAYKVAQIVHRDIKPGNILVDRNGLVKILDMGLARFFNDEADVLTRKFDESVLGTADYLSPEQAIDSHTVDIRADIYSLGATFYFLLSGGPPFPEGSAAQKLIWHQTRQPRSIREIRDEVSPEVAAIVENMLQKKPDDRFSTPADLAMALAPLTAEPIALPPEHEMPVMSAAVLAGASALPTPNRTVARPMATTKPSTITPASSTIVAKSTTTESAIPSSLAEGTTHKEIERSAIRPVATNPFRQLLVAPPEKVRDDRGILESIYSTSASAYQARTLPMDDRQLSPWLVAAIAAFAALLSAGGGYMMFGQPGKTVHQPAQVSPKSMP